MQKHFSFRSITYIIRTAGCLLALLFLVTLGVLVLISNSRDPFLQNTAGPQALEEELLDHLPLKSRLLLPSSVLNQSLSRSYYAESHIFVNEDGVLLQGSQAGSVDQALENVGSLNEYCRETGRDFLYVILPGKPFSDEELQHFGISCQRNATADRFRDGLEDRGIPFLDTRSFFRDDFYKMFYKTDHHWTAEAGLRAASRIVHTLNREYGYSLQEELLDPARYSREVLPDFWTGEMGRKIFGASSRIRDDFVLLTPDFPVHMTRSDYESGTKVSGGFEVLTNPENLQSSNKNSHSPYYYYLGDTSIVELDNEDISSGSLLVIKDSFSNAMLPFLSLSTGHITAWDMRENKGVYTYLDRHPEIKTVMIAYNISFVPTSSMNDFQREDTEQTTFRGEDTKQTDSSSGSAGSSSSTHKAAGPASDDTRAASDNIGTASDDESPPLPPLQMEYLDRGTAAVKTGEGIFLSWRLLGTEPYDTAFEILRNGQKIALVSDSTNYLDKEGNADDLYQVQTVNVPDSETSVLPDRCLRIPLSPPQGGISSDGEEYTYTANDAACADLDGDGREEIVVRSDDGSSLLVYTTTIPTSHKLYTLMHDRTYRMQTASQNAGYNQPPHLGYYVSNDKDPYDQREAACRVRTVHEGVVSERPR